MDESRRSGRTDSSDQDAEARDGPALTRVKICGCTTYDDAARALAAGADAVGFIFAPSERRIEVGAAAEIAARLGPFGAIFGVFVEPQPDEVRLALDLIPG
ncbi:MAG: hypothetical protein JO359_00685, partial [Candidatus Eremiobacteraeota bacterium]|nr:hypothetical protein [Candidatus Eremiobacteraeota bacterium]